MITLVQSVTVTGNGATSHPVTFAGAQTAGNCNVIASIAYSDFGSADPGPVVTAVVDSAGNGHASGPAYRDPFGWIGRGYDGRRGMGRRVCMEHQGLGRRRKHRHNHDERGR